MSEIVQLWHDDYHWQIGDPLFLVTVTPCKNPRIDGGFDSECFVVVRRVAERKFDHHLRRCGVNPLPQSVIDAGVILNPDKVAEEAVDWAKGYLRSRINKVADSLKNYSFSRSPTLCQLTDWKNELLKLRWADELPNQLLGSIANATECGELRRFLRVLDEVFPVIDRRDAKPAYEAESMD